MNHQVWKCTQRQKRAWRVRARIRRATLRYPRPRLTVFRSLKHIYAQVVDDAQGRTIACASSLDKDVKSQLPKGRGADKAAAAIVGKLVASRSIEKGIKDVAFDRGGYKYHGRVAALAEAAREAGLKF